MSNANEIALFLLNPTKERFEMAKKKLIKDKIEELVKETSGKLYNGYSGRGMFGKKCVGVTVSDLTNALMVAGKLGLPKPNWDNMGLQMIIYWPSIEKLE